MHRYTTTPLLCLLAALAAMPALAQERWYQVELLVFSHESGSSAEEWDALPELAYTPEARFLVFPARVSARHEEHGGDSRVDEFGRQLITLVDPQADPGTDIPLAQPEASDPQALPEPAGIEPAAALPTPFIALPHPRRELHGKSAYMQRTGRYRTLFHETWVQPVASEARAIPLVLDDSGALESWPRLQGTVKLHLSRYLHIETNLWLNTSGDYLPGTWRMPAAPLGPPSLIVEAPEPELEPYYVNQVPAPEEEEALDPNALPLEAAGPVYPWRHAVLMQQSRRMRSNEIHYLDHPLLGVVIKFTPLDDEQLAEMAAAEAASAAPG